MKHIKTFEELVTHIVDGEEIIEDFTVEVGDNIYCIYNKGVGRELEIGEKYTVDKVWNDWNDNGFIIFKLKETESRWMPWRFSKDPSHPLIVKNAAKKFNL